MLLNFPPKYGYRVKYLSILSIVRIRVNIWLSRSLRQKAVREGKWFYIHIRGKSTYLERVSWNYLPYFGISKTYMIPARYRKEFCWQACFFFYSAGGKLSWKIVNFIKVNFIKYELKLKYVYFYVDELISFLVIQVVNFICQF